MYIDPTGHSWLSKIIGAIVGIATFFGTGGNVPAAMAAFSFVDVAISSYQAGYNVFQSAGLAFITASVAYAGSTFGAELFKWGGAEAIAAFGAGAFGGMSGGIAHAAMTAGNIGLGALSGLAAGATGGLFATSGNLLLSAAGSSVAGGVGSSVAGGSFAAGAIEGAYSAAANTAMTITIASGNIQGGRDSIAEAAKDNGKHPLLEQVKHDNAVVKNINDPSAISKSQQIRQTTRSINWKTVGIGVTEVIFGVGAIISSLAAGTAATAVTGGTGFAPAVMYAGGGVSSGFALFALGMGEIANGLTGNSSVTLETLRVYYNSIPPEVTWFDVFY